jgi:site-specific DNA recombinase
MTTTNRRVKRAVTGETAGVVRAVLYIRVSTDDQAADEKTSLEDQERRLRAEAERRGWRVVETYRDAYTGTKDERPEFDRMQADARRGQFDVVMCTKVNRLVRKSWIFGRLRDDLEPYGVGFLVLELPFDLTTSQGRAMADVGAVFAQLDRDNLVETMARGQHAAAALRNRWPGAALPFAYRRRPDKTLEPEPVMRERVRTVALRWIAEERLSLYEAAGRMNARGWRTTSGLEWTHANLRRVLTNRSLTGVFSWGPADGRFGEPATVTADPVLTEAEFALLQQALAGTATGKRPDRRVYPLSARITCPNCGRFYSGRYRKDRGRRFYLCGGAKYTAAGRGTACNALLLDADWLDELVWGRLCAFLSDPDRLHAWFAATMQRAEQADQSGELDDLRKREAQLVRALDRANKAQLLADDPDEFAGPLAELRADLVLVRREIGTLETAAAQADQEAEHAVSLAQLAEQASEFLRDGMTPYEQAQVYTWLDVRVTVDDHRANHPNVQVTGSIDLGGQLGTLNSRQPQRP